MRKLCTEKTRQRSPRNDWLCYASATNRFPKLRWLVASSIRDWSVGFPGAGAGSPLPTLRALVYAAELGMGLSCGFITTYRLIARFEDEHHDRENNDPVEDAKAANPQAFADAFATLNRGFRTPN
jgi:hypothetical protein